MDPQNLNSILNLINVAIRLGGELLPVALRAYAALKAESGMTDDELTTAARDLNDLDGQKLADLIAQTS